MQTTKKFSFSFDAHSNKPAICCKATVFQKKISHKKGVEYLQKIVQNDMEIRNGIYYVKNSDYVKGLESYYTTNNEDLKCCNEKNSQAESSNKSLMFETNKAQNESCIELSTNDENMDALTNQAFKKRKVDKKSIYTTENIASENKIDELNVEKKNSKIINEGDTRKLKIHYDYCDKCLNFTNKNDKSKNIESKRKISLIQKETQINADKILLNENNVVEKPLQNIYNFTKVIKKPNIIQDIDRSLRFKPVITDPKFTYRHNDGRFQKMFTIRRQKEIQNPVKLTFVKFHDQIKPPIYEKYTKKYNRNTLKVIENVDYDFDSDAEWIYEDGESVDISESESDEDTSTDDDWIEKDGQEVVRKYEKAKICFENVSFTIFKNDESWLNVPLKRSSVFDDKLTEKLMQMEGKEDVIVKKFGLKYRILNNVVAKKLKELRNT